MQSLASVVEEFSAWTQKDFMRRVRLFCDQFNAGHAGHGFPEDFVWAFLPRFPVSRIAGTAEEWIRWSAEEKARWIEDCGPCRHEQMEAYWLPQPWLDPVIVVEGTRGGFYAWDGNHRIGVAFSEGARTIPAIAGRRKSRKIPEPPRNRRPRPRDGRLRQLAVGS
jgi:hypothetical protein